jgi:23S rRNA (adenine2503-C2)-methyltransferase
MNFSKLPSLLISEPSYRIKQIQKYIFQDLIEDWNKATSLPAALRKTLQNKIPLEIPAVIFRSKKDGTIKALITLSDGLKVETVLMKSKDRNSVCVSSQVGCQLGCKFCATGKMGFKRNLTSNEIIIQVLLFSRLLKTENQKPVTNVVFMGMGEPMLNYNAVVDAVKILNDSNCFGISARKISISTAGIPEGIEKLSREALDINLAFSLHSADIEKRSTLMPVNRKYSLALVMKTIQNYLEVKQRKVMIEYILISGVNDTINDAKNLIYLLQKNKHLFHVNVILYNPTGNFMPSTRENANRFIETVKKGGMSITERFRFGQDISAACGQLALKNIPIEFT